MNKLANRISKNLLTATIFLLCFFPLFTSCSPADSPPPSVTPAPSETARPTNTPQPATTTPTPTITRTPLPTRGTPTITVPDKVSYYSELQPGSYLIFAPSPFTGIYNVISVDGMIEKEYYDSIGGLIAPGGKEVINFESIRDDNYMYTYDMVTEQIIDVHPFPENFLFESWSPNRQLFTGHFRHYVIGVYDWKMDTWISIADGTFPDGAPQSSSNPFWSPDGKWIAFYAKGHEYRPQGGVFAIDTACLETEEPACWETAIGPLLPHGNIQIFWDPYSRYIAILDSENAIQIYDFETGQSKTVISLPYNESRIVHLNWTADGKNIAYTVDLDDDPLDMDLYLVSIAGGEPTLLRNNVLSLKTWLEVPEPVE